MWWPHLWRRGGPERCHMAMRSVGPPMFRSAAVLRVDGPIGAGKTRSAGDVPIAIPKSPPAAAQAGTWVPGGPRAPQRMAGGVDTPMFMPVAHDIGTSEHPNFGSERRARAPPTGRDRGAPNSAHSRVPTATRAIQRSRAGIASPAEPGCRYRWALHIWRSCGWHQGDRMDRPRSVAARRRAGRHSDHARGPSREW